MLKAILLALALAAGVLYAHNMPTTVHPMGPGSTPPPGCPTGVVCTQ